MKMIYHFILCYILSFRCIISYSIPGLWVKAYYLHYLEKGTELQNTAWFTQICRINTQRLNMFVHWSLFSYPLYGVCRLHIWGVSFFHLALVCLSPSLACKVLWAAAASVACTFRCSVYCTCVYRFILGGGGCTWQLAQGRGCRVRKTSLSVWDRHNTPAIRCMDLNLYSRGNEGELY